MNLCDVAPRLARARDQHEAHAAKQARQRRLLEDTRMRLRWLVAHRELQLARAQARGNGSYIDQRQRKLDAARRLLDQAERRAA